MRSPILTLKRAKRLRREMTLPEVVLWQNLRNRALNGLHFRHQHPIGPYILDFYCSSARLCIEIDGQTHGSPEGALHDDARTHWLEAEGIRVLRFAAVDVLKDEHLPGVLRLIAHAAIPSV
jgi:very-short-patch-repair endonuclease